MTNKKQIISKKLYTIEFIEYSDKTSAMNRVNDGFNSMELLGQLEFIQIDIMDKLKELKSPTRVKRKVIVD